ECLAGLLILQTGKPVSGVRFPRDYLFCCPSPRFALACRRDRVARIVARSLGTAPSAANRLRFRPSGPGSDNLTFSENESCVDSSLASLGAFSGAGHSSCGGSVRSGSPSPQPPGVPAIPVAWDPGHDSP